MLLYSACSHHGRVSDRSVVGIPFWPILERDSEQAAVLLRSETNLCHLQASFARDNQVQVPYCCHGLERIRPRSHLPREHHSIRAVEDSICLQTTSLQHLAPRDIVTLTTSLTSARVGVGEVTMLSSICVAVITGFPLLFVKEMRRFCEEH